MTESTHLTENPPLDEKLLGQIGARPLVIRLHVRHVYGIALDKPPGT